jgi:prolyl-tRNA synthetase
MEVAGLRVLLDDRNASAGEKFADADLLGMPSIVVVGKGLVDGLVEVKDRATGERTSVPLGDVVSLLTPVG